MDNFIETYLAFLTVGLVIYVSIWGIVIFFVVRTIAGDSGTSTHNKWLAVGNLRKKEGNMGSQLV